MAGFQQAERVISRCRELAAISETDGGTLRTFLSSAMRRCNETVGAWMQEAGLTVRMDAAGNLRGSRGADPVVLLGSHLDTVRDAGAFDGILGVILAIELAAEHDRTLALEVVGFSEEEGVRFGVPFIGSRALVGTLDDETLRRTDPAGVSVAQAIRDYRLNPTEIPQAALTKPPCAFLEFHIEQGPVLDEACESVGIVETIVGQNRASLHFTGLANHAGTTPMNLRRDALAGAAEWMVEIEALARKTTGLATTVGKIECLPGAGNVIPGSVTLSLDMRHATNATRTEKWDRAQALAREIVKRRGLHLTWTDLLQQPAVEMNSGVIAELTAAAQQAGFHLRRMVSGAGHDAMILAPHIPTGMLFLRSPGGISHHPSEDVLVEDVDAALKIGREFLRRLEAKV